MRIYLLKLTNKCNSNCVFCEIPKELKRGAEELNFNDKLRELKEKRKKFDELHII